MERKCYCDRVAATTTVMKTNVVKNILQGWQCKDCRLVGSFYLAPKDEIQSNYIKKCRCGSEGEFRHWNEDDTNNIDGTLLKIEG